jgi:hypothetical protein
MPAYPSDNKPRRRLQAVPTQGQMIRRRAASPGGIPKMGPGLLGKPPEAGGIPQRRLPQGNAFGLRRNLGLPTLDGRPNPATNPGFQGGPATGGGGPQPPQTMPGGGPGPVGEGGTQPGKNPNTGAQGNPMEHMRYWASKGWTFDPRKNRFVFAGDQALQDYLDTGGSNGGRPNPGGGWDGPGYQGGPNTGGGGGGGGPGIPGGGGPGPTTGGNNTGGGGNPPPTDGGLPPITDEDGIPTTLPLDSYFEAQRRQIADALSARLGYINPQREQVGAQQALQEARLNTNEGVDQRRMLEALAGRGAFGGGIQARDQGYLSTDYLRQRQDVAQGSADAYSGLAQQESEAQAQYSSQLMEALMALAQRQAQSQYAVTPNS